MSRAVSRAIAALLALAAVAPAAACARSPRAAELVVTYYYVPG